MSANSRLCYFLLHTCYFFQNPAGAEAFSLPPRLAPGDPATAEIIEPCVQICQNELDYPCGNRLDDTRWASSNNLLACADGCEISYYAKNEEQCKCYCDQGSATNCRYKHPVIDEEFAKCHTCQDNQGSNDPGECRAGCEVASTLAGFYTDQQGENGGGDACFLSASPSVAPSVSNVPSSAPSDSAAPTATKRPSAAPSADTCRPKFEPHPDAFSLAQYAEHRSSCTAACNAAGYCCTLGSGGCNNVPCATGCHIAWFSSDLAQCRAQCASANAGECKYTWHHNRIGALGFNPSWEWGVGVPKCRGSESCGCPPGEWGSSNDCGADACEAGCAIAHGNDLRAMFFHGEDVVLDTQIGKNETKLLAAIALLSDYVNSVVSYTSDDIQTVLTAFKKHSPLLDTSRDCIFGALDLVDDYEKVHGALFLSVNTIDGFLRNGDDDDGLELDRAMLAVQQTVLDEVYQGTIPKMNYQERIHKPIIADCARLLNGRYWKTAHFFPGYTEPPSDKTVVYSVPIGATMSTYWGAKVCFADEPLIRATGIYLTPGSIATVTVPADMTNSGFRIQVGASEADNAEKEKHRRMDRVTSTYNINDLVTYIASPLGGGIYIKVPYEADLGVVTIEISGGVVQAPMFSMSSVRNTTEEEWNQNLRSAPGVWADFETDKFLMQVPRSWIYEYDYNHVKNLLEGRDMAMDGVSELAGYTPKDRNNYVLYVQPDLHIRAGSYGVGYPQINTNINSGPDGPTSWPPGKSDHWLVTSPFTTSGGSTCLHELGHCTLLELSIYRGESEAVNNYFFTYVMNVKQGKSLDESFMKSMSYPKHRFTIDRAAINWMITVNFGEGNEMDNSNTERDEFRYQQRGYAKYADITRLFGWEPLREFFRQESLDIRAGGDPHNGNDSDDRTYRLSLKAGVDLTPLIHFWGIHPVNPVALSDRMREANLLISDNVKELLERYLTLIPKTNAAFREHYKDVHPDQTNCDKQNPLYGCGWYNKWQTIWKTNHYEKAVRAGQFIINAYWATFAPSSGPTGETPPTTSSLVPSYVPTGVCEKPEYIFFFRMKKNRKPKRQTCDWLAKIPKFKRKKICQRNVDYVEVRGVILGPAQTICKDSCKSCDPCYENVKSKYVFYNKKGLVIKKTCKIVSSLSPTAKEQVCAQEHFNSAKNVCPVSCEVGRC